MVIKQTLSIESVGNLTAASVSKEHRVTIRKSIAYAIGVPIDAIVITNITDAKKQRRFLRSGSSTSLAISYEVVFYRNVSPRTTNTTKNHSGSKYTASSGGWFFAYCLEY